MSYSDRERIAKLEAQRVDMYRMGAGDTGAVS